MRKLQPILSALLLFLLTICTNASLDTLLQPEPGYDRISRIFARDLSREHLSRRSMDDDISLKALDNFIASLDYDRAYFLASDIEEFKTKEKDLEDRLRRGDILFAYKVVERFKERVRDRMDFMDQILDEGFDLNIDEKYHWKRKDAQWCKTRLDWDEVWRKKLKNEYIRQLIAKEIHEQDAVTNNVISNLTETVTVLTNSNLSPLEEGTNITPIGISSLIPDSENKTPEEIIEDRYNQFLTVLEDYDSEWVLQKYLSSFARAFDPHCDYMSQSSVDDFDIAMKLSLVGIGAMLRSDGGAAKIVRLIPGGPASSDTREKRLKPNDKIIAVAQGNKEPVSIMHWPLYKAVRIIRGEKNTKVVLTVIPASAPGTTKLVDLVRDEVKLEESEAKSEIKTLEDAKGLSRKFGIIRLPAFYADLKGKRHDPESKSSSRDLAKILLEMRDENIEGVVLDLRSNGGGSLIEAVLMTGLFIKTGPTVQVRERFRKSILPDNDPSVVYSGPLVVLVNRLSASASEILAGALQDYGRAVIVGDSKTHGKGSVQTIIPLSRRDKTMGSIKVTSALFYRVSGASTQLKGVVPDIIIPSALEYMEFGEDFLPNALEWSTVREVMYSKFDNLSGIITNLLQKSEQRRDNDDRFIAFRKLLSRIEKLNKSEEISLNIDKRRKKAQAEKELLDIQTELLEQSTGETDNSEDADLILSESINILSDLANLQKDRPRPIAKVETERHKTPFEIFTDLFW